MKKIITLLFAGCLAMVVSCGPSAEEKAKIEQQRLDSISAVVEQQRLDSIAFAEKAMQDSMAAANQAVEDSLRLQAVQDSIAGAKKTKKPKAPVKPGKNTKPEDWKAGQGKG